MRTPIHHPHAHLMKYQIREIVDTAQKIQELDPDFKLISENIGDPIAKGWKVPPFLKDIIIGEIQKEGDKVFGYSHSRGQIETRKWVTQYAKRYSPHSALDYEDVLFANGLGAAISALYHLLPYGRRIIQPAPAYPSHSSTEAFHAGENPICYHLDSTNHWYPDLEHLESQIVKHPDIAGILVINPNNPTGAVYPKEILEKIVAVAEKHRLFIISDEVYFRIVYNNCVYEQITEIAQGRVPLIVMRGLSKDVPWPGGRCGWLEFHNLNLDESYKNYTESLKKKFLMEVCSTSLPQFILPRIYEHPDYEKWLASNNHELEKNGNYIAEILNATPGLKVDRPNGAFYMMPTFKENALNNRQILEIKNPAVKAFIEHEVSQKDFPLDQRFTYYLLAATGICVVPATGFYSPKYGFRLTTLDRDDARRKETYAKLSQAVKLYLASA